jgi:hypothetical protein
MSGATDALSSLGSDLTFSMSWAVATELLDAAHEQQMSDAELISVVLGVFLVLNAFPTEGEGLATAFASVIRTVSDVAHCLRACVVPPTASIASPKAGSPEQGAAKGESTGAVSGRGVLSLVCLFITIFKRISISIVVQLLAASVRTDQPLRSVRLLTLLSVAVFFLFLESTSKSMRL